MTHTVVVNEQPAASVIAVEAPTDVDTALTNVTVQTTTTPVTVGTTIGTPGPAGTGVVYTLAGNTSVGATTVSVAPPPSPYSGKGMFVGVGAGTSNCELRFVTAVSGGTLTVFPALGIAHSASDNLVFFPTAEVNPSYFGCAGDAVTDDWMGLQRMFHQASTAAASVGTSYGPIIDGGNAGYRISQPLTFGQHSLRNIKIVPTAGFGPIDATNAVMMLGKKHIAFTATASDNTFLSLGSAFANLNEPIVFNAMYGETLPSGITGGRVYYVKTRVDSTHITVSATVGGAEVDLTSDGGGWFCNQIGYLSKCWWENVSVTPGLADLNGVILGMQQPGEIKRLRLDLTVACTRTTYALLIVQAQIARIYDPEFVLNGAENAIGVGIGVDVPGSSCTGVHISDANFDGAGNTGQTHIVIGGGPVCDNTIIDGETWLEGPGDAGIRLDGGRGTDLGELYLSGDPINGAVYETSNTASWKVGQIFNSGSNHINVKTDDGVLFKTFGSSDSDECDAATTFGGMRRPMGSGPILVDRLYRAVSSSVTARYIDDLIDVNASGGAKMITLRSAVGMSDHRQTIMKNDSSSNTVTIDAAGTETINGATTFVLSSQFARVTVESDGANWKVVSERARRVVEIKVFDDATALVTGDMKASFVATPELNGLNLVDADAFVTTVSSSGTPTVAIRRERSGSAVDMLSTNITIDANEKTSYTAATAPIINASNDDVVTADLIYIDVDVAGTGAKGLGVALVFA